MIGCVNFLLEIELDHSNLETIHAFASHTSAFACHGAYSVKMPLHSQRHILPLICTITESAHLYCDFFMARPCLDKDLTNS